MTTENFGDYQTDTGQFLISCMIFIATFVASYKYKVNPILLIIICGVAGAIIYQ